MPGHPTVPSAPDTTRARGHSHAGKLVSPSRRSTAVLTLQDRLGISQRRASRYVEQHRSTQRHQPTITVEDQALRAELRRISRRRPRWGYRRAHRLPLDEGWEINRKRTQRLWLEEGLRVPQKRRKRQRLGESTVPAQRLRAEHPDHVWAIDFQFDQTTDGHNLKLLHVVDEFTREALRYAASGQPRFASSLRSPARAYSTAALIRPYCARRRCYVASETTAPDWFCGRVARPPAWPRAGAPESYVDAVSTVPLYMIVQYGKHAGGVGRGRPAERIGDMSKPKSLFLALIAFVAAGVATSTAFALPHVAVTLVNNEKWLACYEVSEFKVNEKAGWYTNNNCTVKGNKLEGRFELSTPSLFITGSTSLWCAWFDVLPQSGHYNTSLCKLGSGNTEIDGLYDEINAYPLLLSYENTTLTTELETTAGSLLQGRGLKTLSVGSESPASGTFRTDFSGVRDGTKKCMSTGDAVEVVLVEGSFHLVYTDLSPLLMGTLGLINEVTIECEGTNSTVKGSILSSLIAEGNTLTELTSVSGQLLRGASAGKPKIEEYYNDAGTKVKAKLETTTGGSTKESNMIVEGTPVFSALGGKMFVITSR